MVKKAVLIGCNYPFVGESLEGCVNDVKRMQKCLVERYHFSDKDITVLIDTDYDYTQPTGHNIRAALDDLVKSAQPGDFLFVHYSGHGTRIPAKTFFDDDTGYDECIVPTDLNLITDDEIRELVNRVPEGCQITIVSDSCHSGGLIDEAKEQIGQSTYQSKKIKQEKVGEGFRNFLQQNVEEKAYEFKDKYLPPSTLMKLLQQKTGKQDMDVGKLRSTLVDVFGDDASPKVKKSMNKQGSSGGVVLQNDGGNVEPVWVRHLGSKKKDPTPAPAPAVWKRGLSDTGILISGCQSNETSTDHIPSGDRTKAYGALSNAIQTIIVESDGKVSNRQLVLKVREMLKKQGFTQSPGLYCSDPHADASFIC